MTRHLSRVSRARSLSRTRCLSWARPLLAALCLGASAPIFGQEPASAPPREGQRADERRSEQPLRVDLFGRRVALTGSWEYSDEQRTNFDLLTSRARDRRVGEHEVKLEARWLEGESVEFFLQAVGLHERRRTEGTPGVQTTRALERGQTWVRFREIDGAPLSLQIGRVALVERRGWWWDDDLDAIRLDYRGEQLRFDIGIGRNLARVSSSDVQLDPAQVRVSRGWGQLTWRKSSALTAELFWLTNKDTSDTPAPGSVVSDPDLADESDLDARWTGLRFSGRVNRAAGSALPRLTWWADAVMLRGQERRTPFDEADDGSATAGATTQRRVRSHAHDVGATLAWLVPLQPSFTLSHAQGSGGAGRADLDVNFRQTGLQENKGRIAGVKRLRYYGELLAPELSNLAIATAGVGLRLFANTSLEALLHRYTQVVASRSLAGSRLSVDPGGEHRDIGREVDVVLAVREWRHVELSLVWAQFRPGLAFAANRRDTARSLEAGLALNF